MSKTTAAADEAGAAATPAAEVAQDPRHESIAAGVRAWLDDHIRNGPIARDVALWNHLMEALAHLPALIAKEL